jgi:hypothetical protein
MTNRFYILAVVAILVAVCAPNASATLQLTLHSGSTTIVVNDNGVGDSNAAAGQITFIGAVGANWTLNVTTGTVDQNPLIDLNSVDSLGTGSGTGANALTLKFSATGYTEPFNSTFISTIGGTLATTHSLSYQGYIDTNDTLNATTTPIGGPLSFSNPPAGFNGTVSGGAAAANQPFSLTQVVVISGTSKGTTSFDASIDAVPEPATMALFGGVLLTAFGILRRKTRQA